MSVGYISDPVFVVAGHLEVSAQLVDDAAAWRCVESRERLERL